MNWLKYSPLFSYGLIVLSVVFGVLVKYDVAAFYAAVAAWLLLHWDIFHE